SAQKVVKDLDHGHGSYHHFLAVTADGKWVGMSGNDGLGWYTLPALTHKGSWKLDKVGALALRPDGKLIAVDGSHGSEDRPAIQILDAGANRLTVLRTLAAFAPAASAAPPAAAGVAPPKGSEKVIHEVAYQAQAVLLENDRTTKEQTAT